MPNQALSRAPHRRPVLPRRPARTHNYIAVIGDMVNSRNIPPADRQRVQQQFTQIVDALNRDSGPHAGIASKFIVTIGDEFQGILSTPELIPDLIWKVTQSPGLPPLRLGFGFGPIDTVIPEYAINLDGPALHRARAAVDQAKSRDLLGGVFTGFGEDIDRAANGVARLLWFQRKTATQRQLQVLDLLRQGNSQGTIADILHLSDQAISDHARAVGWEAWKAGESALRAILNLSTPNPTGNDDSAISPRPSRTPLA